MTSSDTNEITILQPPNLNLQNTPFLFPYQVLNFCNFISKNFLQYTEFLIRNENEEAPISEKKLQKMKQYIFTIIIKNKKQANPIFFLFRPELTKWFKIFLIIHQFKKIMKSKLTLRKVMNLISGDDFENESKRKAKEKKIDEKLEREYNKLITEKDSEYVLHIVNKFSFKSVMFIYRLTPEKTYFQKIFKNLWLFSK